MGPYSRVSARTFWQAGGARADGYVRARGIRGSRHGLPLLQHEDVGEEVRACSPVFLGHARTHQPELRQLAKKFARKLVSTVPFRRMRIDLRPHKLTCERLYLALILRQLKVHRTKASAFAGIEA